ncbi:MAG TPA: hypothetical protein VNO21_27960 [Polyangiaceae bacterium]|nr:hypothetical protein [Polyangiaceae bacterium]
MSDARLVMQLTLMGALYSLSRWFHSRYAWLPEDAYFEPFVFARALVRPRALACLAGPALPLLPFWARLRWTALDPSGWLRGYTCFLTLVVAVFGATYAFNWFFRRAHLLDRAMLIFFGAATFWHPLFAIPTAAWFLIFMRQFLYPINANADLHIYCHKVVFAHQLLVVAAYLYASVVFGGAPPTCVLLLGLMVQGAHYVASGIGKLRIRWVSRTELVGLVSAAVAHRWLHTSARWVAAALSMARPVVLVTCVALEIGASLLTLDSNAAIVLLIGLGGFHIVVLLVSGINFLPWAVLDGALAWGAYEWPQAFGVVPWVTSLLLFVALRRWWMPYELAWFDARLCTAFRIEARSRDGTIYELTPDAFAPYDVTVANGKFACVCDEPIVVGAWAEFNNVAVCSRMQKLRTAEDVAALERAAGINLYNAKFTARVLRLLTEFARAVHRGDTNRGRDWLARDWPRSNPALAGLRGVELACIDIRIVRVLYDDEEFRTIDDRIIHHVELAPSG